MWPASVRWPAKSQCPAACPIIRVRTHEYRWWHTHAAQQEKAEGRTVSNTEPHRQTGAFHLWMVARVATRVPWQRLGEILRRHERNNNNKKKQKKKKQKKKKKKQKKKQKKKKKKLLSLVTVRTGEIWLF
jgi:hypothetical protein